MATLRLFLGAAVLFALPAWAADELLCESTFVEQVSQIRRHVAERELTIAGEKLNEMRANLSTAECAFAPTWLEVLEAYWLLENGRLTEADERLHGLRLPAGVPQQLEGDRLYIEGALAYELGQYRRARSHWEKLLELDRAQGNARFVVTDLYNVATTYLSEAVGEESRDDVAKRFREVLAAADRAGSAASTPNLYIELGKLLGGAEGLGYLQRGLALAKSPEDRATALGGLAVERLRDDPAAARALIDRAVAVAEKALEEENPWPLLYLWVDRLPVRWAVLPREEAIADSLATLRHIEEIRRRQSEGRTQAALLSVWSEAYQWLAGRLLEDAGGPQAGQDVALAFHFMERYRARVLAERLEASGTATGDEARTADEGAGEGFSADLDGIAASLGEDEALLSFQVASRKNVYGRFAGGSWLLVVSRDGTRAYRLPDRGPVERRVRMYLGLLATRGSAEGEAAARLYRDLLAPALAELPAAVDKLILVPDGDLHLLPFGALRATVDAPPLAARYQLSAVPSATLWQRWRRNAPAPEDPAQQSAALVLADPLPNGAPAVPLRAALGRLPFAAEEGKMVVRRVAGESLLRVGSAASEAFLKSQDLSSYQLVHFATHAMVDEVHPERSAVYLAPGNGEDGELRPHEIAELDLEGDIIVLSACRSASGGVLRGEGVMGLARAFFQAGASTVLGSLWPLADQEAQLLFDAYYRHLARGRSIQGALQGAQQDLREAGAPVAAWAGVVVLGDGARVPLPAGSFPLAGGIAVAVVLVAALLFWMRRRR